MNKFEKETLDAHNRYRACHHATPLSWNHNLALDAQSWAERLAREDRLKHASTDDGENIYMSFGDVHITGNVAVDKWYQEVKEYSFIRPGFQSNTGHFTQIVWRGSKEIGVGKAVGYDGKVFVVARYRPAGNNLRTFDENVLPAQKYMTFHNSSGWDHTDSKDNTSVYNKRNAIYSNLPEPIKSDQSWKISDRWDPVYTGENDFKKKREPQQNGPRYQVTDRHSGGSGRDSFVDHKWDSGKWFDEDAIEPAVVSAQHSSPERKILQDNNNATTIKRSKSPGIAARWQPGGNGNQKDSHKAQQWKAGRKGYSRDSVDRNKSINKVRMSTEKWETIGNDDEIDSKTEVQVGRNRTRESIKRWEEQQFNKPSIPFRHPRPLQSDPIKVKESKQVFSERWDPLWGNKPMNDSRQRPVSWDSSRFNEDKVDSFQGRPYNEPKERKITTTIDDGPKKTVVSSLTIILKGNEGYAGPGHKSRSKSTEDLRHNRPKSSYTRKDYQPVREVCTEKNAGHTYSKPKSEDINSRSFNDWESRRRPIDEDHIVPEVKTRNDDNYDYTDNRHGNRDVTSRRTFPALDYFSRQALECHNVYRALHSSPNLMWSPQIAEAAQAWAEHLARQRTLKHSTRDRGSDGENLAMFTGNFENAAKEATDMWYEEVNNYDFSRPGYQPRSGHFTQMVWKESKEFGMGRAKTSDGQLNIVVARYRPAGNVIRNYELNVFPKHSFF